MSDVVSRGPAATASSEDRILTTAVYVLYFVAPFFCGFTALVGAVIAYARRPLADALNRTHYAFQIRLFWIGFALLGAAAVAALAGAGVLIAHLFDATMRGGAGWDGWDVDFGDEARGHLNLAGLVVLIVSTVLAGASVLWTMLAAVFGVARLLSGEPIGRLKGA
jgi:uncharacterized membrane protein